MDLSLAVAYLLEVVGRRDHHGDAADEDAKLVSQAIVIWTGWGNAVAPIGYVGECSLRNRFGDNADALLRRVEQLEAELDASGPAAFRDSHPELSETAVSALSWRITFDKGVRARM